MREDSSGIAALRRKRRKNPTQLRTMNGVVEIIPGLSTWTPEDLVEAGAWDEELAELADIARVDDLEEPEPDR